MTKLIKNGPCNEVKKRTQEKMNEPMPSRNTCSPLHWKHLDVQHLRLTSSQSRQDCYSFGSCILASILMSFQTSGSRRGWLHLPSDVTADERLSSSFKNLADISALCPWCLFLVTKHPGLATHSLLKLLQWSTVRWTTNYFPGEFVFICKFYFTLQLALTASLSFVNFTSLCNLPWQHHDLVIYLRGTSRGKGTKLRSCVKVEVAVLGFPSLIVLLVSVNVEQHIRRSQAHQSHDMVICF